MVGQLPAPVGSPVQLFKLATGSTVYLYQGGTLHWIPSEQVFYARGYQWDNVYDVANYQPSLAALFPNHPYYLSRLSS